MDDSVLIRNMDDLLALFHLSEKPKAEWRVGTEAEKFGVYTDGSALVYEGSKGVEGIFTELITQYGWEPLSEGEGKPTIALKRGRSSVTLEPAAQFELSGGPMQSIHECADEFAIHLHELKHISEKLGIVWLGLGFHPWAKQNDLPWVPKMRYGIMRQYLPTKGSMALDMMRRTCTVQANLDYCDETDAMRKLQVGLRLAPIVTAMFANSPIVEGALTGERSHRAEVWLNMDPDRSGLLPTLWKGSPTYQTYIEWALDVPMFLIKRDGKAIENTQQTFRQFLKEGLGPHRATKADWELHLNTMFPEVRLKNIIEVRSADGQQLPLSLALPALWKGIFYDERSLAETEELTKNFDHGTLEKTRTQIVKQGLRMELYGLPLRSWAERIVEIATDGLRRQASYNAQSEDESIYLRPLSDLVAKGETPADRLIHILEKQDSSSSLKEGIMTHAAIDLP